MDNLAALMALVNGRSNVESLDAMARVAHALCFAHGTAPYFDYVESKSNWSDEISREELRGKWARKEGFALGTCELPTILLRLPWKALLAVAQFL